MDNPIPIPFGLVVKNRSKTRSITSGGMPLPPSQISTTMRSAPSRRIVYRFLTWNPWQHVFFRLLEQLRQPLRC
jgi:hypothetical protein